MIYLYAITEPGTPAPERPGLDEQPLEVLEAGEVSAVFSRHERGEFEPEPEAVWCHDRVVERAMGHGPVLPARFASTFTDTAALAGALRQDQAGLRRRLNGVRGCVELAVRLSLPRSDQPAPRDGREYLAARLVHRQESRSVIEQTLEPLAKHALRAHRGAISGGTGTLTASYLVPATEVEEFTERVRQLAERHAELSLSCTGPWPPYSFVGEDSE